ncbi:hypothetical protein NDU88_003946 [Pleurodeles waltl]|uniref:Uncharacterized protein n=1 Tax=Pleurodeles waltl TaxID=8319 RepID=A0AAV7UZW0_PLEWA|nr:hypothetical protein NDU88_003946 [Pleurodeles waltl]
MAVARVSVVRLLPLLEHCLPEAPRREPSWASSFILFVATARSVRLGLRRCHPRGRGEPPILALVKNYVETATRPSRDGETDEPGRPAGNSDCGGPGRLLQPQRKAEAEAKVRPDPPGSVDWWWR